MDTHRLCPPCFDLFQRWACAPMNRGGIRIHSVGDSSAHLVEWARQARVRDHYALIERQSRGVVENCRAGRHAAPRVEEQQ